MLYTCQPCTVDNPTSTLVKILQVLKTNSTRQISCCLMKTSVKLISERKEMQMAQEMATS